MTITNASIQVRSIGKAIKLANCTTDYLAYEIGGYKTEGVNHIEQTNDPIDILCAPKNLGHLTESEFSQATALLSDYKDLFGISNSSIGRTNITEFDIDTPHIDPVSTPLRRVPLHKEHIVKQLLQHYESLGLIEKTDSPFLAATVLVEKKNASSSTDLTDQYRSCVDYRFLNKCINDSAWSAPFLEHCLDAAVGSQYLSSLDFNSGYHRIPYSDTAKEALVFSPGFGFAQFTWNVMPQGIKPASNCFQRTMEKSL